MFFANYKHLDETLELFDRYTIPSNTLPLIKTKTTRYRWIYLLGLLLIIYKVIRWYLSRKNN